MIQSRINRLIGKRLRELRKEFGYTIDGLSAVTGVGRNVISSIELAKHSASMTTLHKLAAALKIDLAYLITENNEQEELEFWALKSRFNRLSAEDKERVIKIIQAFSK